MSKYITTHADIKKYKNGIYWESSAPIQRLKKYYFQFERKYLPKITDIDDIKSFHYFFEKLHDMPFDDELIFIRGLRHSIVWNIFNQLIYLKKKYKNN